MTNLQVGHDINAKVRTADVSLEKNVTFKDLFLTDNVLSGLSKAGFHRPSPIQLNAIPFGRCGLDLIVQAKSGTGKTCVFSVIALEAVVTNTSALQAIILAPTREIALQISSVLEAIGQCMKDLVVKCFVGGLPVSEDKANARGCHIAVGTPGRMFQLLQLGILSRENVRLFVLDEADKLLEHSFQSQINSIYSVLPINKQMIAASATYPEELAQFVTKYMQDPTFVRLNPKDMALIGIKQYVHEIPRPVDKYLSDFEYKIKATLNLLEAYVFTQALVFSNYHSHAKDLSDACNSVRISATYISGNLAQKKRLEAIQLLKEYKCKVLISTDLTSRGIDASNVDLVINLDVPHDWETYMHRTGRAGRFGSMGAVISVVLAGSEMADLLKITEICNIPVYRIACVDGSISHSMQPMKYKALEKEDTSRDSDSKRTFHERSRRDIEPEDGHMIPKRPVTYHTKIVDTRSDDSFALTDSHDDTHKLKLPKILSLPEIMHKKETLSNWPCLSFDSLIDSFAVFKKHGKLTEIDQTLILNEEPRTHSVGDGCYGEIIASVPQNIDPQHKTAGDEDTLGETERDSMNCCRLKVQIPASCDLGATAHCRKAGEQFTDKPIVPEAEPLEGSSWVNKDGGFDRSNKPYISRKKKSIPLNSEKRHIPKENHSQYSPSRHDYVPMLLPRCTDSLKVVRPNFDCATCHRTLGRLFAWKWHSDYHVMYWMWLNQYMYEQSWYSNT